MRALVIGGSGLFGSKTCQALLNDPDFDRVVAFDVAPPSPVFMERVAAPQGDRYKFVKGDISDLEQLLSVCSANQIDRIVNWAMILSKDPMPRENTKIGVLGMCNVFEAAKILGIKRVVYASSETVYGEQKDYGDRDIIEDDRLLPFTGSFYALAKCLAEVVASQYDELYGVKPTALRPASATATAARTRSSCAGSPRSCRCRPSASPCHLECTGDWLFSLVKSDDVAEFTQYRAQGAVVAAPGLQPGRSADLAERGGGDGQEVHPRGGDHLRHRVGGLRAAVEGQQRPGQAGLRFRGHAAGAGGQAAHRRGTARGGTAAA